MISEDRACVDQKVRVNCMHQAVAAFQKAAEVLKQAEDKAGNKRRQFLEVVQNHISQVCFYSSGSDEFWYLSGCTGPCSVTLK